MLEGEYLELCNELKKKYDELQNERKEIERQSFRLKRNIMFYASMVMALDNEVDTSGIETTTIFNSILDVLHTRVEEDMQTLLHQEVANIAGIRMTPVIVDINLPSQTPSETTENN